MNNNQQQKPDPKGKAIASLLLGVISVSPIIILSIVSPAFSTMLTVGTWPWMHLLGGIAGLCGLILGIKGIKKWYFSVPGIVLCLSGLLPSVFLLLVWITS